MLGLDVFNSDAFSVQELTAAVNKIPTVPGLLGSLPIFTPKPVRTPSVTVESYENTLTIIPVTPRGAPPSPVAKDRRVLRDFRTVRIAQADRIGANEISGIRQFGSMSELMQVQDEVTARLVKLKNNTMATIERLRLGAIQGIVTDSDDSTIVNYFTDFGISAPSEIDFDLDNASPASGAVRKLCNQVVRAVMRAAKGAWLDGRSYVAALCGDTFFDQLVAHSEIRGTYLNQVAAAELRDNVGQVFSEVRYGGIRFINYRGTDDGSTIAVGATKAKFFPVDAPGAFEMAMSPLESLDFVNTPGQEHYAMIVPDLKRNAWVDVEVYAYPLPICTRPEMLQSGRNT